MAALHCNQSHPPTISATIHIVCQYTLDQALGLQTKTVSSSSTLLQRPLVAFKSFFACFSLPCTSHSIASYSPTPRIACLGYRRTHTQYASATTFRSTSLLSYITTQLPPVHLRTSRKHAHSPRPTPCAICASRHQMIRDSLPKRHD